jgi:hypothetical protein
LHSLPFFAQPACWGVVECMPSSISNRQNVFLFSWFNDPRSLHPLACAIDRSKPCGF